MCVFCSYVFIWFTVTISSLDVVDEVGDIVGHLWGGGWSTVLVVDHSIMKLARHANDHVIEVGVEGLAFWDVHTLWGLVVVPGQDVVHVIESTGTHTDLGEIGWPHTTISVLGLILREVGGVNSIVDVSITFVPLLVVVLLEVMVRWVNREGPSYQGCQLQLTVSLIEQDVVLLVHDTVTVTTIPSEHDESTLLFHSRYPRRKLAESYVPRKRFYGQFKWP